MNNQHLNEKKSRLSVDYFEKMHIIKNRKEDEVAIMLIQFSFKNFKSFREEAALDLSAARMTEFSDRVVTVGSEKILPVAAIYGANASGKSNIYSAFEYMAKYVADSFKYGDEEEKFEEYRPTPFLFDSTSADAESSFEVYFTIPGDKNERTYNYGFCVDQEGVTDIGGTLRLGSYPCVLDKTSKAYELYGEELIHERHRHRYEVNNDYRKVLTENGMMLSGISPDGRIVEMIELKNDYRATLTEHGMKLCGTSPDGRIVEMIELPDHPWFIATQAHPELKSRPNRPHPLFRGFITAALEYQNKNH